MKKKGLCVALGLLMLTSHSAWATCVVDLNPIEGGPGVPPSTLEIPSYTIYVDADTPENTVVSHVFSNKQMVRVTYLCPLGGGSVYGLSVLPPLTPRGIGQEIFSTEIEGLKVRPSWYNSAGKRSGFELLKRITNSNQGRLSYKANSHFGLEFIKAAPGLSLNKATTGDRVLGPGIIAYSWVNNDTPADYAIRLQVGEIRVISTPVCKINAPGEVDFNTVSLTNLSQGVTRPLDFSINCITDYGTYSAQASVIARESTPDGFIKVTDRGGNTDRMKIRIDDDTGRQLPVDGSGGKRLDSVASNVPANFHWRATLLPGANGLAPQNGAFSATAEIILVVK